MKPRNCRTYASLEDGLALSALHLAETAASAAKAYTACDPSLVEKRLRAALDNLVEAVIVYRVHREARHHPPPGGPDGRQ